MKTFNAKKAQHYLDVYCQHFSKKRDDRIRLLEIGVQHGGSLKMWKNFFSDAEVIGIDIDPKCKEYEEDGIEVIIGDQEDRDFLKGFKDFDIIIDDGGHTMFQQKQTFEILFPMLKSGGIYVIEDLHTSYWREFGGGTGTDSTMEFLKDRLIEINEWAFQQKRHDKTYVGIENKYEIDSIHFYQSLAFIYKK